MDYVAEARKLMRNLNQRMSPSAYDTAWLARLRTPDGDQRWPELLDRLVENQRPDGSWGGEIPYYHDRILCTLTAIIALRENGHTRETEAAIKRGERYLWHHLHRLPRDPFELVGFELIFPTLLEEARALKLDVPNHTCGYGEIQTAKLRLLPPDKLYSPKISTVHSLEFLGRNGDPERLRQALAVNGSLGNSPAATAYYLMLSGYDDERAWKYLEEVRSHMSHVIYLYPFRIFELTWTLNHLLFSGMEVRKFTYPQVWNDLLAALGEHGAGLDPVFGIPDGDITSVTCRLLLDAGYDMDPQILRQYENENRVFKTYDYERNVSVSTNVHALETLYKMPYYPDNKYVQEQIILMLLDNRKYNTYWTDKWHASPYYVTSHALVALLKAEPCVAHYCIYTADWLSHTQRHDGSWGFFEHSTIEETAYALIALLHWYKYDPNSIQPHIIHKGASYLAQAYQKNVLSIPPLWIGKDLYVPYAVVNAIILAALILYENVMT